MVSETKLNTRVLDNYVLRQSCTFLRYLSDAAKIFPISLIAFEKMRKIVVSGAKRMIQLTFSRLFRKQFQYTIGH